MPKDIDQRICLVVDPMLATGGSAEMAISYLRERGVKDIRMHLCIAAAPEGLKSLTEKDPDVHIYTCAIDDHLNEAAYIVSRPGRRRRSHLRHALVAGLRRPRLQIGRNGARGQVEDACAHL